MKISEFWDEFVKTKPQYKNHIYNFWSYGSDADTLAQLTFNNIKTATSSLYDLYVLEGESIPKVGAISIVLDATKKPRCIIQITKVSLVKFKDVTAQHAFKEGEGDRSLNYWHQIHIDFFNNCTLGRQLKFSPESLLVLE